jgi:hypothetical protein
LCRSKTKHGRKTAPRPRLFEIIKKRNTTTPKQTLGLTSRFSKSENKNNNKNAKTAFVCFGEIEEQRPEHRKCCPGFDS